MQYGYRIVSLYVLFVAQKHFGKIWQALSHRLKKRLSTFHRNEEGAIKVKISISIADCTQINI